MTKKSTIPIPPGPSQTLISRIAHLQTLLRGLPKTLPLNPEQSTYNFGLDPEKIADGGAFGAFSSNMEICFRTYREKDAEIHFVERGRRLEDLITTMKKAVKTMSEFDRQVFEEAWLERLITAAVRDGAKILKRKQSVDSSPPVKASSKRVKLNPVINIRDSDSEDDLPLAPCQGLASASKPQQTPSSGITMASRSIPATILPTQQSTLKSLWKPFSAYTPDEQRAQLELRKKRLEREENERKQSIEAAERKIQEDKDRKRELGRIRQQVHRDKVAAAKAAQREVEGERIEGASRQNINTTLVDNGVIIPLDTIKLAETSRAGKEGWRKSRNGKLGGATQQRARRTNWQHPFLWPAIDAAMRKAGWSEAEAVKILHRQNLALYGSLKKGTIWRWKASPKAHEWKASILKAAAAGHALTGSGKSGALAKYPEIVREIQGSLRNIRASGIGVNVPMTRSIMLATITERQPAILNSEFQCSESFVRKFLQSVMSWSPRQATRAAGHIPPDVETICERTFFRIVYAMKWENIPAKLVVNGDQMGVYVLPCSSHTFHDTGADQVDVVGKEEKRAFTLMATTTPTGVVLPFHQVWGGKTALSLPTGNATGMNEAKEYGFDFAVANSPSNPRSHFSTLSTMKQWITNVIEPYRQATIASDPTLGKDQKMILYIDAYPVHTGKEFREWMSQQHPKIILCYVPHNCTPVFQPADVGLQRPIKHMLKQSIFQFMIDSHRKQMAAGVKAKDVKITTSLPELRDASVAGLVKAFEFLQSPNGRDLIKMAWRKSTVKKYCLSEECLTSKETHAALSEYLKTDTTLHNEIASRLGVVQGIDEGREDEIDAEADDDTDIPLEVIIQETIGESLVSIGANGVPFTVCEHTREEGRLVAGGVDEDLWSYDKNGDRWEERGNLPSRGEDDQEDTESEDEDG